jgi:hypothetical protein
VARRLSHRLRELTDAGATAFRAAAAHHIRFVCGNFLSKFTRSELRQMGDLWSRLDDPS